METIVNIVKHLDDAKIRPSYQRIKIFEYLLSTKSHPTVAEIYEELLPKLPTLSKMTVYNTLKIFVEQGIVKQLSIDDSEIRYDADLEGQCHIQCQSCGKVYDVEVSDDIKNVLLKIEANGFCITNRQMQLKGICTMCAENKNNKEDLI